MKENVRKKIKRKSTKRIALDNVALRRCDPGIRRLLLMSEAAIIKAKENDEKRMSSEVEAMRKRRKKVDKQKKARLAASDRQRLIREIGPLPHPVFGPVIVDFFRRRKRAKIRAIVNFSGNADDLRSLGITVHSGIQNVFTVNATRSQLAALASQAATQKISIPRLFYPTLHDSVPTAEIDQIHSLGTRGNGTILGVVDGALHVEHHAFLDPNPDPNGDHNTRVKFMWVQDPDPSAAGQNPEDYFQDTANHPNSPNFTGLDYGIIYDEAAINTALGLASQNRTTYGLSADQIAKQPSPPGAGGIREPEHGTHVAGIAAGSGHVDNWGTNPTNVGGAPLADIVHVCYRWSTANVQSGVFEDDILDALRFVMLIAGINQPVVINNSYGTNVGPHNGLTDFDQARNALLDSFLGRSLVYASGNDNTASGFRKGSVPAGSTDVFTLTPWLTPVWVEIWYDGPDLDFRVNFQANSTGWITSPNEFHNVVGAIPVDVDREVQAGTGLKNIRIFIQNVTIAQWSIDLRNNSANTSASYVVWTGVQGWWADLSGPTVDEMTLHDTSCARGALTVGSCDKQIGGNVELIADYSGRGPTYDGRIKPEITAVGGTPTRPIMSADSRTTGGYVDTYVDSSGNVQAMCGTSMAAPVVAGAIALLFEGNPDLDQDTIKGLLTKTADRTGLDIDPDATGFDAKERNAYGFGRLRMLAPFQHSFPLVDVDVFVKTATDDYGFEAYPGDCFCHAPEVKILDSANAETNTLEWDKDYTVKVRIHNLGDTPAVKTKAEIKYTRPWTAPTTWTPCTDSSGQAIIAEVNVPALGSVELTFDKKWRPKSGEVPSADTDFGDHYCLLVELDHPNDPKTFDNNTAAGGEAWRKNIKGTNNVALRNLAIK
jgi:hypothetical protein